jgi:hypothetical protein
MTAQFFTSGNERAPAGVAGEVPECYSDHAVASEIKALQSNGPRMSLKHLRTARTSFREAKEVEDIEVVRL